jgi:hypothetical protein
MTPTSFPPKLIQTSRKLEITPKLLEIFFDPISWYLKSREQTKIKRNKKNSQG